MKQILFLIVCMLSFSASSLAQASETFKDSVIGWKKVYNFQPIREMVKVDDKTYSAAQLTTGASFGNWIQASYTPKGGLGDVRRSASEKLGLYNQHTAGKPQSYGAYSKTQPAGKVTASRASATAFRSSARSAALISRSSLMAQCPLCR